MISNLTFFLSFLCEWIFDNFDMLSTYKFFNFLSLLKAWGGNWSMWLWSRYSDSSCVYCQSVATLISPIVLLFNTLDNRLIMLRDLVYLNLMRIVCIFAYSLVMLWLRLFGIWIKPLFSQNTILVSLRLQLHSPLKYISIAKIEIKRKEKKEKSSPVIINILFKW